MEKERRWKKRGEGGEGGGKMKQRKSTRAPGGSSIVDVSDKTTYGPSDKHIAQIDKSVDESLKKMSGYSNSQDDTINCA